MLRYGGNVFQNIRGLRVLGGPKGGRMIGIDTGFHQFR